LATDHATLAARTTLAAGTTCAASFARGPAFAARTGACVGRAIARRAVAVITGEEQAQAQQKDRVDAHGGGLSKLRVVAVHRIGWPKIKARVRVSNCSVRQNKCHPKVLIYRSTFDR
jgi:hypothetical protein